MNGLFCLLTYLFSFNFLDKSINIWSIEHEKIVTKAQADILKNDFDAWSIITMFAVIFHRVINPETDFSAVTEHLTIWGVSDLT